MRPYLARLRQTAGDLSEVAVVPEYVEFLMLAAAIGGAATWVAYRRRYIHVKTLMKRDAS